MTTTERWAIYMLLALLGIGVPVAAFIGMAHESRMKSDCVASGRAQWECEALLSGRR